MPTFTLTRSRALVAAAIALVVVFGAAQVFGSRAGATTVAVQGVSGATRATSNPLTAAAPPTAPAPIVVIDVVGAVRHPGLYRLPQGSRIADAVARAGGETRRADSTIVNLAAPLADGELVVVPERPRSGSSVATGSSGSALPSPSAPVSLNNATAEQLDALPGIGPVTAEKIIAFRQAHGPFTSVDQLDAISGIGPARIENLKGLVQP